MTEQRLKEIEEHVLNVNYGGGAESDMQELIDHVRLLQAAIEAALRGTITCRQLSRISTKTAN